MSRVAQAGGVQILPPVGDPRGTVTMWLAQQCINADHRKKHPAIAAVAADLVVEQERA